MSAPQAAGITGILTAAGLGSSEIHGWFRMPRRELGDLSPAAALELGGEHATPVLDLARSDAASIAADLRAAAGVLPGGPYA
jgi:hypothetical protein